MADGEHASSPVVIRDARVEDVPQILAFIRELAEYERLAHTVETTTESLREHLFGARPAAEVLLAELGTKAAGFALFFHNFSTFKGLPGVYLEDLYVRPQARGRGVGKALLAEVAKRAVQRGCGRMEWAVLDWNEPAINFYRSLGAQPLDQWTTYRLTGENLAKLAAIQVR
jgi:GNAT superfamily N-acetyltransferase